jgi:hypothetical protein
MDTSSEGDRVRSERVRVTAPTTRSAPDLSALLRAEALRDQELDREESRRLLRARLRLSVQCAVVFLAVLASAGIFSSLFDTAGDGALGRWLVLALAVFAAMVGCAWRFLAATLAIDHEWVAPPSAWDTS